MADTFQRIILKGARSDRALLLAAAIAVEEKHGPLTNDERKLVGLRLAGRAFSASITKRSITVQLA